LERSKVKFRQPCQNCYAMHTFPNFLRFKVFTAVKMWIVVFSLVTPCSFVGGYQNFAGTCPFIFKVNVWRYRR
jgi:hypothetical protein